MTMSSSPNEAQIAAEVERLRREFPRTADLYREVCALLFFRYGVTPTANRLYQLVKKGSMSAPVGALNAFWRQLREASRVSIAAPEVPESLRDSGSQLLTSFWKCAQDAAETALSQFQRAAQAEVDECRAALSVTSKRADEESQQLQQKEGEIARHTLLNSQLASQLSDRQSGIDALQAELSASRALTHDISEKLENLVRSHASEIDTMKAASAHTRDSFLATERRLLLELDRERTALSKLQKGLELEQSNRRRDLEKHGEAASALHSEAGSLRQTIGVLEGKLAAAMSTQSGTASQLEARDNEISTLREKCIRLELALEHLAAQSTPATKSGEMTRRKSVTAVPKKRQSQRKSEK